MDKGLSNNMPLLSVLLPVSTRVFMQNMDAHFCANQTFYQHEFLRLGLILNHREMATWKWRIRSSV